MKRWLTVLTVLALCVGFSARAQVVINEVVYNDSGTDDEEFVELRGTAGLSLQGYELVGVNGNGGTDYRTVTLTGVIPGDGYYVVAMNATVPNGDQIDGSTWQNGPDSIELRFTNQGGSTVVVDKVCYGDAGGVLSCEGTHAPDASSASLARCPDGSDTNDNSVDFVIDVTPTPGVINDAECGAEPMDVTVCELMADDANGVPLLLGALVRITDVVALNATGVFRASGSGLSVYVHQPSGEGVLDGCCVNLFDTGYNDLANPIDEGDFISEIVGTVTHFNGLTELTAISVLTVSGTGTIPNPHAVTASELATGGESYEGCLVKICGATLDDPLMWPVSGNAALDISDGTGTTQMFVDGDTDIDGTAVPGEPFTVMGIAGQFDATAPHTTGYQILPRRRTDILDGMGCPVPTKEATWGQIKSRYR